MQNHDVFTFKNKYTTYQHYIFTLHITVMSTEIILLSKSLHLIMKETKTLKTTTINNLDKAQYFIQKDIFTEIPIN